MGDNTNWTLAGVKAVAAMPSREELNCFYRGLCIAAPGSNIAGVIGAPASNIASVLIATIEEKGCLSNRKTPRGFTALRWNTFNLIGKSLKWPI